MALAAMKLTAAVLLITMLYCTSLGAGSSHEVVPSLLQTLLEGSVEQLYAGPISRYNVDEMTSAALTELKKCIDELPPQHLKALVNLLFCEDIKFSDGRSTLLHAETYPNRGLNHQVFDPLADKTPAASSCSHPKPPEK